MVAYFATYEDLQKALRKCKKPSEAWKIHADLEQRMCELQWLQAAERRAYELEREANNE